MKKKLALFLCVLSRIAFATDWVATFPITKSIVQLKFDDGYILHSGYRQDEKNTKVFKVPLDIDRASSVSTYSVTSTTDADFSSPIFPSKIGRKTKGKDFSNDCNWQNSICDNEFVNEHSIYLFLPKPMKDGHVYVVMLDGLAANFNADTLHFSFKEIGSAAIHVNQVGFKPDAPVKYAYLSHWLGDAGPLDLDSYEGTVFHVVDFKTKNTVFQGQIKKRSSIATAAQLDLPRYPDQGFIAMADVWECDFSSFSTPGEYIIAVEEMGTSFPFRINDGIYREPYYHATRQLYHQRSGIALEKPFTNWTRPRNLHPEDKRIKFQYTRSKWLDWPNNAAENGIKTDVYSQVDADFKLETWGWYMDAGDWDGYYNHLKIPRLLMTAYELFPNNFSDGELNIPESGNGIPDILDEAQWLIDYLDRTRGPSGGIAGARIHPDFEKKSVDHIPSWEDERIWTISGEDHITTYTFSGLAAHLSFLYKKLGLKDEAQTWEAKSREAYVWAKANSNPAQNDSRNARLYGAACLFKLTGENQYQQDMAYDYLRPTNARYALDNFHFALWMYLTTDRPNLDTQLYSNLLMEARSYVDNEFVETAEQRSFRVGFGWNFRTFLGQATTPLVFPALVMYHVTGEEKYYRTALTSADYVLGGNPMDFTWMVGLGHQNPRQMLHLDTWLHPDGRTLFIPGTIPYGPTAPDEGWPPNNGPWSSDFAWNRIYPNKEQWPLHEGYFDNRYCVPTNEYTVHQTSAPAAAVYGMLSGISTGDFKPNQSPKVSLNIVGELVKGATVILKAEASDEDGEVISVVFYHGKQKIGEKRQAPFEMYWKDIPEITGEVVAVATDNQGKKSNQGLQYSEKKIENIIIEANDVLIDEGQSREILVNVLPADAIIQNLVWSVTDTSIAFVTQSGVITGRKAGETFLIVRALDGQAKTSIPVIVSEVLAAGVLKYTYNIFPNPVKNGKLDVLLPDSLKSVNFQLVDFKGILLFDGILNSLHQKQTIDVSDFPAGIYLIYLQSENQTNVFKLLIE